MARLWERPAVELTGKETAWMRLLSQRRVRSFGKLPEDNATWLAQMAAVGEDVRRLGLRPDLSAPRTPR